MSLSCPRLLIITLYIFFFAPSGAQNANVRSLVCMMKVCLELTIFFFLSQGGVRSPKGLSLISLA